MINSAIEALYIFDHKNDCILEHVYCSRPHPARLILPQYLSHPSPRPSLLLLDHLNPSTLLVSITHADLLLLSPVSGDTEPLFVLEFLHRAIDVLEEFVGSPLLASRIESAYDVVAQLLGEMCDAGVVCNTEPNALRDDVEVTGWMGKLLEGVGLPSSSPALQPAGIKQQLSLKPSTSGPAIPWRRANVRHTSNELYVDILEILSVTLAPSGRPLAALAHGSIAFTSKISGVPDLLLTLSASGGKLGLEKAIDLPVFHPCVRLSRWKDRPGELSFVPPDGKFMLASYEVNLLPLPSDLESWSSNTTNLRLPVSIEIIKSLGPSGSDFEIHLLMSPPISPSGSSLSHRPGLGSARGSGRSTPVFGGGIAASATPSLQDVSVSVPVPGVRNIMDLRSSRGEAYFSPADTAVEWRIPAKEAVAGIATLRCTIVSPLDEDEKKVDGLQFNTDSGEYNEFETYQSSAKASNGSSVSARQQTQQHQQDLRKVEQNKALMPRSASLSFSVKGWLASGIRVDGLTIDARKSRGLGEGVRPYKGVKYLTVSRKGVETRC